MKARKACIKSRTFVVRNTTARREKYGKGATFVLIPCGVQGRDGKIKLVWILCARMGAKREVYDGRRLVQHMMHCRTHTERVVLTLGGHGSHGNQETNLSPSKVPWSNSFSTGNSGTI